MSVVECRSATRHYGSNGLSVTAVDRVDLVVEPGTFVAIEGPSGSGKTTLLGLLAGLELADGGEVSVLGHDLARLAPVERARLRQRRIGIVFQTFGLLPSLTVGDNVGLPLMLAGMAAGERANRIEAVLAEVGLASALRARVDELSGGERQRVGVARALVGDPDLILADEPTGSLDEDNAVNVLGLMREAVGRRRTALILATHDPRSASQADQRYAMRDGRLTIGESA